jgi:hypothetical protein
MSLVVAMLPDRPFGYPPLTSEVTDSCLYKLFIDTSICHNGNLSISFNQMPSTFICSLQVKTRFYAMIGGAWKHGCALVLKDEDGQDSYAIVYEIGNSLMVLSAGKNNSARSIVLLNIISLINERYKTLVISDLLLTHENCRTAYNREDLQECLLENGGLAEFKKINISILSLELIINFQGVTRTEEIMSTVDIAKTERPVPKSLFHLGLLVSKAEERTTDEYDVEIKHQLQECIQDLLSLLNVCHLKGGLNSMWIILEQAVKGSKEITLSAIPLSPNSQVNQPWIALDEAIVVIDDKIDAIQDSQLRVLGTDLLRRTLLQLGVSFPRGSIISVLRDLQEYEVNVVNSIKIKPISIPKVSSLTALLFCMVILRTILEKRNGSTLDP